MKMLGLEKKYKEEVLRSENEKEELILKQKAEIDALTASLNAKTVECEELKEENNKLKQLKEEVAHLKEYISILEALHSDTELAEQLRKTLEENTKLSQQVQYLSLLAPKKSEKQKVKTTSSQSEQAGSESSTSSSEESVSEKSSSKESQTEDKTADKKEIKHRKKGKHNGNNGARLNWHEYDDIKTTTIEQEPELPEGIDISKLEFMDAEVVVKFTAEIKTVLQRVEYLVKKYKDPVTGIIYNAKVPATPLRRSVFTSAFIALVIYLKFAAHISVSTIQKMFCSSNFNISDRTLNGLINKVAGSQFFRNLDTVLRLVILESVYLMMDETFAKVRTEVTEATKEFIAQFYIWVQLSVDIGLIRYSSCEGSRRCEVGYELVEHYKGLLHSDAYRCYKNIEKDLFPEITRLACIQHTKRYFLQLAETDYRAKEMLDPFNELYVMDDARECAAKADAQVGKEWTLEDHINWRKQHAPEILQRIKDKLNQYANDPTILPDSKLAKAIRHVQSEMGAIEAIFEQEHVLCKLDTNMLEVKNRAISMFRRISQAFGSITCGENQCIYFSLAESCHLQNVNVQEYFTFLLDKMPTMNNCIINDINSPQFEAYRKLLPDVYAKEHPVKQVKKWEPKIDKSKPIHEGAKRKAYKKHTTA